MNLSVEGNPLQRHKQLSSIPQYYQGESAQRLHTRCDNNPVRWVLCVYIYCPHRPMDEEIVLRKICTHPIGWQVLRFTYSEIVLARILPSTFANYEIGHSSQLAWLPVHSVGGMSQFEKSQVNWVQCWSWSSRSAPCTRQHVTRTPCAC